MESRAEGIAEPAESAEPGAAAEPSTATAGVPVLARPRDCVATGVAAGLAVHLGWPVWIVRAAFIVLTFVGGAGVLLYAWLWAFTPWAAATGARRRGRSAGASPVAGAHGVNAHSHA